MDEPQKMSILKKIKSKFLTKNITEDEIKSLVSEGQIKGVLEDNEAEMIHNIIDLDDKNAKDVMTHRKDICAVNATDTLEKVASYMVEMPYSRYPVYKENIDNIIGIISIKDTFKLYQSENNHHKQIFEINGLLRPAKLIPETREIYTLFNQMIDSKSHMAIVVDEYGQTSGVVALEDIIEEIVGDIFDEHDKKDEDVNKISEDRFIIKGTTLLEEIEKELNIEIDDEENETLNGFLTSLIDHIPEENEKYNIEYKGYNFKILKISDKVIDKVLVTKL